MEAVQSYLPTVWPEMYIFSGSTNQERLGGVSIGVLCFCFFLMFVVALGCVCVSFPAATH